MVWDIGILYIKIWMENILVLIVYLNYFKVVYNICGNCFSLWFL